MVSPLEDTSASLSVTKNMKILGIESSCDETSAAIVDIDDNKIDILANVVSSQMEVHEEYGGVVPEIAARNHAERIHLVVQKALNESAAGDGSDLDLVAVTRGPGLKTSLLVGITAAETLAFAWGVPVIGVNHLEGHVLSPFIDHHIYPPEKNNFPFIILSVSGGHTQIILMRSIGEYEVLGTTIDDAAGEAFDKVAKMMNLGYPGGPIIDRLAKNGNAKAFDFPRPMIQKDNYDFSFSGLKTAVKYTIRDLGGAEDLSDDQKNDLAASFQRAVVDVLITKTLKAAEKYSCQTIFLAGGVGANSELRSSLESKVKSLSQRLIRLGRKLSNVHSVLIDRKYSGDNAAMIAVAGYFEYIRNNKKPPAIEVDPKLRF